MMERIRIDSVKIVFAATLLAACTSAPTAAWAASPFDGKQNMVCAINRSYECGVKGGCMEVEPEDVDVSAFFLVNVKKKEISAIYPPDEDVSPIEHIESQNGATIIQGSESGRGWGIVVDQETGKLSASVYGRRVGFLLYGACMPKK